MYKRSIKYTDFDGNDAVEVAYFNLGKSELLELEMTTKGGFAEHMKTIGESSDSKIIFEEFKKLVLMTHGVRDGNRFIKTDETRQAFTQTQAYDALIWQLATDAGAGAEFLIAVMPADLQAEVKKLAKSEGLIPSPPVSLAPPGVSDAGIR